MTFKQRSRLILGCALIGSASFSTMNTAHAEQPALIPRDILFGNPERTSPQLSPDGKQLAWIAPDDRGVLQVWVRSLDKDDSRVVTADKSRGIRQFFWTQNSDDLLYLQDSEGDENFHVHGVSLATGQVRDFTPGKDVRADLMASEPKFRDEVLITTNARNPTVFDVYKLHVKSGELTRVAENPGDVLGFQADADFVIRGAQSATPDGGMIIRVRDGDSDDWREWITAGPEDNLTLALVGFTADGRSAYVLTSIGRDTAAVVLKDVATGAETVIAESPTADADGVMINPKTKVLEAVSFSPGRTEWQVVDPTVKADFDGLAQLHPGDFNVVSRDEADRTWLVRYTDDRGPSRYYSWDRDARKGTFLFTSQPKLEGLTLASMKPVQIPARDGLTLNGYLTLPAGVEPKGLPMILLVHGGPWARDVWGFNPTAQWFANRGYACLQVNYRGSTGYGKSFLNAANKQWGKTMHDDLIDAKRWAVAQGYVDPEKVAIFGGSYGGYAALAGVTLTPTEFACAVDIVGPSNLATLIQSIPPYWKPMRSMFDVRLGNIDDPADADMIRAASPLFKADRIVRPLMIGQGANDPRVKQAESEQIVEAIEKANGAVSYILYPDEGHGFARPANRIDFFARAEHFLAKHLGGRAEPLPDGGKVEGSTAVIREIGQ